MQIFPLTFFTLRLLSNLRTIFARVVFCCNTSVLIFKMASFNIKASW